MKLRPKTRAEQDFYLQWADRPATEEERLAFLCYDSRGGLKPYGNPILQGKTDYHLLATEWRNAYFTPSGYEGMWPGGANLVIEARDDSRFLAMLAREFGAAALQRWFVAAWEYLFLWVASTPIERLRVE